MRLFSILTIFLFSILLLASKSESIIVGQSSFGGGGGASGSIGTTTHTTVTINRYDNAFYNSSFTASPGVITYAHAYVTSFTGYITFGIYTTGGTRVTQVTAGPYVTTQNNVWINVALPSPVTLNATSYYIGVITKDSGWGLGGTSESASRWNSLYSSYNPPTTTLPTTLSLPGGIVGTDGRWTVFFDNSPNAPN